VTRRAGARLAAALLSLLAAADGEEPEDALPVEPLRADPARDERARAWIEALRKLDAPADGIDPSSGGGIGHDAFRENAFPSFRELARMGPAALPLLLDHLDDRRETALRFRMQPAAVRIGGLFARPALPAADASERTILEKHVAVEGWGDSLGDELPGAPLDEHAVTVGDCCFAILGQIVNRVYEPVSGRGSNLTLVRSPTRDPKIAAALRALWGRGDPCRLLAASLLDDLRSADGFRRSGAPARLLLYFPDAKLPALERRIGELWSAEPTVDEEERSRTLFWAARTGHPIVRAAFAEALLPDRPKPFLLLALECAPEDPGEAGRARIRALLGGSADAEILAGALRLLPEERPEGLRERLERGLAAAEPGDRGTARAALEALAILDGEGSLAAFRAHMGRLGEEGCRDALFALEAVGVRPGSGVAEALLPELLRNRAAANGARWTRFSADTRICDWAAGIVARSRPDLPFDSGAPLGERDLRIAAMRAALRAPR